MCVFNDAKSHKKKKDHCSRICGLTSQPILDSCELKWDKQQGLAFAVSNFG